MVRYFKGKQYNWSGLSQQPSLLAKARRGLLQFTPYSWDNYEWHIFSSPKRCLQVGAGGDASRALMPPPLGHRHPGSCTHLAHGSPHPPPPPSPTTVKLASPARPRCPVS